MELIIGGAHQGKTEYVMTQYHIHKEDISDGNTMDYGSLEHLICINQVHRLIKRIWKDGKNPIDIFKKMLSVSPDVILVLNEIGSGIVPIDWEERRWREQVGITGCYLAGEAKCVMRIVCGIPIMVKGSADEEDLTCSEAEKG